MNPDADSMGAMHAADGAMHIGPSMESGSSSVHQSSNCDQICGYCISQNMPAPEISDLQIVFLNEDNLDRYSPPTPAGYSQNLFRPPIPA